MAYLNLVVYINHLVGTDIRYEKHSRELNRSFLSFLSLFLSLSFPNLLALSLIFPDFLFLKLFI